MATIGEVLESALAHVADDVESSLAAALADEPDGVHQQRVRVRRLRSILAGFRGVLDARAAERVRVAYAEWGRELGIVRDIEVRAAVAEELLERVGATRPEVVTRLVDRERSEYAGAHERLVELARQPRAVAREGMLRSFAAQPGIADPARQSDDVVRDVLRAQVRRVRKAARRIDGTDDSYHALRKAARRMRYVAEAVLDADPDVDVPGVADIAHVGDALHDVLGDHRDAVLFAEHVAREAVLAVRAGELSNVYDVIEAAALADAQSRLESLPKVLKRLRAAGSALA